MDTPGLSTLGVLLGYASQASSGLPAIFTLLSRINAIGGLNLDVEQIDASALEDAISQYVAGRADNGGYVSVTVNFTEDTLAEWEAVISQYETDKKGLVFEVYHPTLTKGFFFVAEPPKMMPMPEVSQNGLLTVEMKLTVNEYKGLATAVKPSK